MVTEEKNENTVGTEEGKIRRQFDEQKKLWYFSIVDVIEIFTNSTDARNYWKVLKNRLKKADPELVTKINQLKMKARDGKFYMTDTADMETMIRIMKSIPKANVEKFNLFIKNLPHSARSDLAVDTSPISLSEEKKELPTPVEMKNTEEIYIPKEAENKINIARTVLTITEMELELLIDAYQTASEIFIIAMVAGVELKDLNIFVKDRTITINGKRPTCNAFSIADAGGINDISKNNSNNYLYQELCWTTFSRTLTLPSSVQEDKIETFMEYGKLTIRLTKI